MRVAVVGAGWAGCAAAIELADRGAQVLLLEAARHPGGRARRVDMLHQGRALALDNGQHILIGAYQATLGLMQRLGVEPERALKRLPLRLCFADGSGLRLPAGPATLSLAWGLLAARGWSWSDKRALMRWALLQQGRGFECPDDQSVRQVCQGLPESMMEGLLAPLCVSALNTPIEQASGRVFLRVLRDALLGQRGSADLLLPLHDLSALLPQAALRQLRDRGHSVQLGARVLALRATNRGWELTVQHGAESTIEGVDAVLLACPGSQAVRLLAELPEASVWRQRALALQYEAIATVYAFAAGRRLTEPLLALRASAQAPAQFVFDRGQLGGPQGLLAFVVSASRGERAELEAGVRAQAERELGLGSLELLQTVIERRATFACTPALRRPGIEVMTDQRRLLACGDYIEGPYPATLEGAVRSGLQAARHLR